MGLWLQEQLVCWAWEVQLTVVDAVVCKVEELLLGLQQRWGFLSQAYFTFQV